MLPVAVAIMRQVDHGTHDGLELILMNSFFDVVVVVDRDSRRFAANDSENSIRLQIVFIHDGAFISAVMTIFDVDDSQSHRRGSRRRQEHVVGRDSAPIRLFALVKVTDERLRATGSLVEAQQLDLVAVVVANERDVGAVRSVDRGGDTALRGDGDGRRGGGEGEEEEGEQKEMEGGRRHSGHW